MMPSRRTYNRRHKRSASKATVLKARDEHEIDGAFAALVRERVGAVLVTGDTLFNTRRPQVIALAERFRIPAIYDRREYPTNGGLMSYGANIGDQYRQSGRYVARILKGAQPADLPVLQPTKFELVININTAKEIGTPFRRRCLRSPTR